MVYVSIIGKRMKRLAFLLTAGLALLAPCSLAHFRVDEESIVPGQNEGRIVPQKGAQYTAVPRLVELTNPGLVTLVLEAVEFVPNLIVTRDGVPLPEHGMDRGPFGEAIYRYHPRPGFRYVAHLVHGGGSGEEYLLWCLDSKEQHDRWLDDLSRRVRAARAVEKTPAADQRQLDLGKYLLDQRELHRARELLSELASITSEAGLAAKVYLGDTERHAGKTDRALEILEEVLAKLSKSDLKMLECYALNALGDLHLALRQRDLAEQRYRRCREVAVDAGLTGTVAIVNSKLARFEEGRGDLEAALALYQGAVNAAGSSPDQHALAEALFALGAFHLRQKNFKVALSTQETTLQFSRRWQTRVATHGEIGMALLGLDREEKARSKLYQVRAATGGRKFTGLQGALFQNMAILSSRLGEYAEARRNLLELLDRHEGPSWIPERCDDLTNLGTVEERLGLTDVARDRYETALRLAVELDDRLREAQIRTNLARLLRHQGELTLSIAESEKTLALARDLGNSSLVASALTGLADSRLEQGDLAEATRLANEALAGFDSIGWREGELNARLTLARAALAGGNLARAEELLGETEEELLDDHSKRLTSVEAAGRRSRYHEWGMLAQDLSAEQIRAQEHGTTGRREQIQAGLRAAGRWKGRSLLDGLAVSPDLAKDLVLEEGVAVLEITAGQKRMYGYLMHADKVCWTDLGDRDRIESLANSYVDGLNGRKPLLTLEEVVDHGGRLHELLLSPLLDAAPGAIETLVVVPDPSLVRLPFEALVVNAPAEAEKFSDIVFVDDRFRVSYAPSIPILSHLQGLEPPTRVDKAMMFGNPIYHPELTQGDSPPADPGNVPEFKKLPNTGAEILRLARKLRVQLITDPDESLRVANELEALEDRRSGSVDRDDLKLAKGANATVDRLLSAEGELGLLHLACHGHVDELDPRRTGIYLSWQPDDLGRLGLRDIDRLRCRPDLVVLSACQSANGRIIKGDGVYSMASAFLRLGSRAVVATLWSVGDEDAEELMEQFYRAHLKESHSRPEALRMGRRELRSRSGTRGTAAWPNLGPRNSTELLAGHPYFWAPFIHIGALK